MLNSMPPGRMQTIGQRSRMSLSRISGVMIVALLCTPVAHAQTYPEKPIRVVVPYAAGGPNDIFGRLVARKLAEIFGQQVVIDNRPGASGNIGAELVARGAPDGYTLLLPGAAMLTMNTLLLANLRYDPVRDFAPVSLLVSSPFILVTHPALPVKSVQELVSYAKARPGQLNFASVGAGGATRLAAELFKGMTGIDMVHVPYNGGGLALTSTMSGEPQLYFTSIAPALQVVREGKLRGLAVSSAKRTEVAPEFPTIAESGVAGFETGQWFAIVAPAATPKARVARLNGAIAQALKAVEMRARILDLGADPIGGTPDELAAYVRSETAKWAKVIKAAGIKPE